MKKSFFVLLGVFLLAGTAVAGTLGDTPNNTEQGTTRQFGYKASPRLHYQSSSPQKKMKGFGDRNPLTGQPLGGSGDQNGVRGSMGMPNDRNRTY